MEQNHDMDEIDLLELARLLWSHALQIAAAGIAAAVICLLVCTFVLTPRYQASVRTAMLPLPVTTSTRPGISSTLMQSSSRATSS